MGTLVYAGTRTIHFDDRTLAHLQIVMREKLRRKEGFFFSWDEGTATGGGRGAIWIDNAIPLLFRYQHAEQPQISRRWLESLAVSSDSPGGLVLVLEE